MTPHVIIGLQEAQDALRLVSYCRDEIASARLSGRSPTMFSLECLLTLESVFEGALGRRSSTHSAVLEAALQENGNVVIIGAT